MNKDTILQSNLLDIIFDNRNKDYGAYTLRKSYNSRMGIALFSMIGFSLLFCLLFILKKNKNDFAQSLPKIFTPDKTVTEFHSSSSFKTKSANVSHVKKNFEKVGPPKIVTSININKLHATLPEIPTSSLQSLSGTINFPTSVENENATGKPEIKNIVPVKKEVLSEADVMPQYPGGVKALLAFLKNNLHSPEDISEGDEVNVKIKFVVNYNGKLESFDVIKSGGTAFDNEVIRVLKKMPLWIPGKSNGENVSAYYIVPVKFTNGF